MQHPGAVRSLMIAGTVGALALHGLVPASASPAVEESCFLSAVNAARSAAGAAPLSIQGDLLRISRAWSQTMATAGQLFHDPNLTKLVPSTWQALGENVGTGPTCDSIAQAFMNSPEHRRNILDPAFTTVGVGVVDSADGTVWVTEDFMGTGAALGVPVAHRASHHRKAPALRPGSVPQQRCRHREGHPPAHADPDPRRHADPRPAPDDRRRPRSQGGADRSARARPWRHLHHRIAALAPPLNPGEPG